MKIFFKFSFFIILLGLFLLPFKVEGQSYIKTQHITLDSTLYIIDSLSIIPSSLYIIGLNNSDYEIDYEKGLFILKNEQKLKTIITINYRTFNFSFSDKRQHKMQSLIEDYSPHAWAENATYHLSDLSENTSFFDAGLQKNGSISRGITIGNRQDLSVNSSLNLQLNGKLSEDIEISANITDQNIPIQPEGNTQSIQDFDKVFIHLKYKDIIKIEAGNVDFLSPKSNYLSLNKRTLGLQFLIKTPLPKLSEKSQIINQIGGGITKGKYAKNTLTPIEGNQGPYQLTGNSNELYIIIIAGSERIYIDGKLLKRGEDQDYTIDYNTGEVTFTTKRLITASDRIIAEFEYSDKNYTHYMLYTANEFIHEKNQKLSFKINFFHEEDLKNQSIQPELNDEEKYFLSQLDDDITSGYYPQNDSVTFSSDEVLYRKCDTIINGIKYNNIYVYSNHPNEAHYRLNFTFFGSQKGNYIQIESGANGRVFAWVAPINDIPQGNYEPVILLTTPKRQEMLTIGADYEIRKNTSISTEFAFSNNDLNTFSSLDNEDNLGCAYRIFGKNKFKFNKKRIHSWYMENSIGYEFIHKNFTAIEPFQAVEFERDYNIPSYILNSQQHTANLNCKIQNDSIGYFGLDINYRNYGLIFNALRTEISNYSHFKTFSSDYVIALLNTKDSLNRTLFFNGKINLKNEFKVIELGIKEYFEYNQYINNISKKLTDQSYAFNETNIYIKSPEKLKIGYELNYKNRINQSFIDNTLKNESMLNDINFSLNMLRLKNNSLKINATYRHLSYFDSIVVNSSENDNFFLASIDYSGKFWKGFLSLSLFYEAGTGMEQKKNYSFVKVTTGQGTHIWIDYNQNGIEELNEFEVAIYQNEANYLKIWSLSTEYENVYTHSLSGSLNLKPYIIWRNKKGFLKFLSLFSNQITIQINQKSTYKNIAKAYIPFCVDINDNEVITNYTNFKNNFLINPLGNQFGIDWSSQYNENKTLLTSGFEQKYINIQQINIRYTFLKNYMIKTSYNYNLKRNISEFFSNRNYKIQANLLDCSFMAQFKNKYKISVLYNFGQKENIIGYEKLVSHKIGCEINLRIAKKTNIVGKFNFISLNYNNSENSSISYEMLEGLNNGKNYTWSLAIQTYLINFLQLNLNYEGRYSEGYHVINTGSLQLRASF